MSEPSPWILLSKPVRAPFRDGTSVLVRNLVRALPGAQPTIYFGDPQAPLRPGDRVLEASAMAYQPRMIDKAKIFARLVSRDLRETPIHSFFAPNRASCAALELVRRMPRRRRVMQTLPASKDAELIAHWLKRLDRVVVTSQWGRERLLSVGLGASQVVCIYPGVEIPPEPRQVPLGSRQMVLFAGDLDHDVGTRLRLLARALGAVPGWTLTIAARPKGADDVAVRAGLEQGLAKEIAAGRVTILGEVPNMGSLFDAAAVQVYLASHTRNKVDIPFALLEGLARGVPVVALDRPPVRELYDVGAAVGSQATVLLRPHAFEADVEALCALLVDPARLEALGDASVALVHRRFSVRAMADLYMQQYRELS